MKPYYEDDYCTIYHGDCRDVLPTIPEQSIQCCVTSPPYYGLRDYGVDGQIGLEQTPDDYVAEMVRVFGEVKRVLRDDGTLWLNLGDSYASTAPGTMSAPSTNIHSGEAAQARTNYRPDLRKCGLKPKDLIGIPWRVAFALQQDGWYLRQDIIWHKPNPMPESVTDRCTKSHEYIFLLSKSAKYYYDADAIAEPVTDSTVARCSQPRIGQQIGSDRVPGKTNGNIKAVVKKSGNLVRKRGSEHDSTVLDERGHGFPWEGTTRNKRSVWTVSTQPYSGAHFAVFPPDLIRPCILAGCPKGGTVLDPFGGSGTTAEVCKDRGRKCVSIELNPEYLDLEKKRLQQEVLPL